MTAVTLIEVSSAAQPQVARMKVTSLLKKLNQWAELSGATNIN